MEEIILRTPLFDTLRWCHNFSQFDVRKDFNVYGTDDRSQNTNMPHFNYAIELFIMIMIDDFAWCISH